MIIFYEKLRILIRDHTFFMSLVGVLLAGISASYAIGFQLGQNRQVYLEDKLSDANEEIERAQQESQESKSASEQARGDLRDVETVLSDKLTALEIARQENINNQKALGNAMALSNKKHRELEKENASLTQQILDLTVKYEKETKDVQTIRNLLRTTASDALTAHSSDTLLQQKRPVRFERTQNWVNQYLNKLSQDGMGIIFLGASSEIRFGEPKVYVDEGRACYEMYVKDNDTEFSKLKSCSDLLNLSGSK